MEPNEDFHSRLNIEEINTKLTEVRTEIRKILIGQSEMVDLLLAALLANGHILIEGVPGIAKTLTAKLLAHTLSIDFSRLQFTPDLMPSDVTGTSVFNPKKTDFEFRKGPIFANIVLVDEINRAPAKTQSALFEVMQERQVTVDGITYLLNPPFIVVATQNPVEHEGTYRLPEAELDRFLFKIDIGYPELEEEKTLLKGYHERGDRNDLSSVKAILSAEDIIGFQNIARNVHIEDDLIGYIAGLTHSSRNSPLLSLGASPRASLAILSGAKALAIIKGRDFVTPEDVQTIAYPALRHRLLPTPEKEMEGLKPDDVISRLLEKIEVPR